MQMRAWQVGLIFCLQVIEDLLNDHRILDTGDDSHRLLDPAGDRRGIVPVGRQVEVNLVDAAVFDLWHEGCDGHLEPLRVVTVGREIRR